MKKKVAHDMNEGKGGPWAVGMNHDIHRCLQKNPWEERKWHYG